METQAGTRGEAYTKFYRRINLETSFGSESAQRDHREYLQKQERLQRENQENTKSLKWNTTSRWYTYKITHDARNKDLLGLFREALGYFFLINNLNSYCLGVRMLKKQISTCRHYHHFTSIGPNKIMYYTLYPYIVPSFEVSPSTKIPSAKGGQNMASHHWLIAMWVMSTIFASIHK